MLRRSNQAGKTASGIATTIRSASDVGDVIGLPLYLDHSVTMGDVKSDADFTEIADALRNCDPSVKEFLREAMVQVTSIQPNLSERRRRRIERLQAILAD